MKVKNGSKPVPGTPKVGTESVLKIFRFGKFGTGNQNNLLISDHGFHTNNIVTIQLFWLIFFRLYFSVFFSTFSFYSCQQFCSQHARGDFETYVNTD
ncbi:hypothetical protein HanIR_Chr03g0127231 [Helianthus annuus]|nr:hypothetical protein HanIR_Chr03g0127231 [Helianthus annuus]